MVRNKKTQSKGANQPRRSITKAKANGFKTKKGSNKFAQTFQKVANTSPGKMLKQQIKRKSLQSPGINAHKRHKQQASEPMTTSNSTNVNNNRLPDKSKEVPNGTVNQQKSNGKDVNSMQRTATATIVIDDSDEENGPTSAGATETATGSTQPLFYIDRNPGIRDAEVPLYVVGFGEEEPATNTASFAIVDPENESVIVLDSTFEQTVSNSMKEMQINVDVQTVQPSGTDTVAKSSSSCSKTTSSSSSSSGNGSNTTSTSNVQNEKKQPKTHTAKTNIVSDVIDLSDYSDTEQPCSSYAAKTSTPAFPSLDRIPLGYNVATSRVNKPRATQEKSHRNGKADANKPMSVSEESEMIHRKRMIIIDGNNVAYGHLNGKMFSVKGLELCINYFKKLGHEVTAVVPQFKLKKHQSTDYVLLEKLHRQGDVTLAPCKSLPGQFSSSYDDRLILSIAEQFDGVIISNDNYRDLLDISPEWRRIIETRVVGYSWVKDCFFLPDDPYGRYGPTLQQILNGQSC